MAIQLSVAARNSRLDAIETATGTSAKLLIFTGAVPANCAAADPGVFQLTSTPAAGITITNPSAGTAEAVVSAAQTSLVAQQNGGVSLVYDIKLKDSTGDVTTLESGTLKINPSPTGATS